MNQININLINTTMYNHIDRVLLKLQLLNRVENIQHS
jgi:hypothetical protein